MNQNFYDKEYNAFQVEWREKYVKALEEKKSFLTSLLRGQNPEIEEKAIRTYNDRIESLELEHKIFHEKIALADWIMRKDQHNDYEEKVKSEMNNEFPNVLKYVEANKQHPRLSNLMLRYNGVNKQDKEEMQKIYLSMKTALEQLKIEWK